MNKDYQHFKETENRLKQINDADLISTEDAEKIFSNTTINVINNLKIYIPASMIIYFIFFKFLKWLLIGKILIVICFIIPILLVCSAILFIFPNLKKHKKQKYLFYADNIMLIEAFIYLVAIFEYYKLIF